MVQLAALVRIMAWHRPGDKPLSEPMVVGLLMHICVTWPQWVNTLKPKENGGHFMVGIFKCMFLLKKTYFDPKFTWVFSWIFTWWFISIGLGNGLMLCRRQAITYPKPTRTQFTDAYICVTRSQCIKGYKISQGLFKIFFTMSPGWGW